MRRGLTLFVFLIFLAFLTRGAAFAQQRNTDCAKPGSVNATVVVPRGTSIMLDERPVSGGARITVHTAGGVCVGQAWWDGSATAFPVWGDDAGSPLKDGLVQHERLRFRIQESDREYEATVELAHGGGAAQFEEDAVFVIASVRAGGHDGELPAADDLRLGESYPNPFSTETTIPFDVSEPGPVVLKVFDAVGRLVATLVDGDVLDGPQEVRWEPEDLPSGTYFVRLQAGEETETRSLVHVE